MENKAKISNELTRRIIECVKTCITENKGRTLELMDGSIVRLSPQIASKFIAMHDELNENSQEAFRLMLVESKKTFEGVVSFCKEKN